MSAPIRDMIDLDKPARRRGKPTSRDVVQHAATKYGFELTDLSDEKYDHFWRESDKSNVEVLYARGGGRVISVWLDGVLANIGYGRGQAINALGGDKVVSDLRPKTRR